VRGFRALARRDRLSSDAGPETTDDDAQDDAQSNADGQISRRDANSGAKGDPDPDEPLVDISDTAFPKTRPYANSSRMGGSCGLVNSARLFVCDAFEHGSDFGRGSRFQCAIVDFFLRPHPRTGRIVFHRPSGEEALADRA
jgi:hypothetical protein